MHAYYQCTTIVTFFRVLFALVSSNIFISRYNNNCFFRPVLVHFYLSVNDSLYCSVRLYLRQRDPPLPVFFSIVQPQSSRPSGIVLVKSVFNFSFCLIPNTLRHYRAVIFLIFNLFVITIISRVKLYISNCRIVWFEMYTLSAIPIAQRNQFIDYFVEFLSNSSHGVTLSSIHFTTTTLFNGTQYRIKNTGLIL